MSQLNLVSLSRSGGGEDLIDQVPCVSGEGEDAVLRRLPVEAEVREEFVEVWLRLSVFSLSEEFEFEILPIPDVTESDTAVLDQWWAFPAPRDASLWSAAGDPWRDWYTDLSDLEQAWVNECCSILGGPLFRFLVQSLKGLTKLDGETKTYPDSVGYLPSSRYTTERLFDRLHINCYYVTDFAGDTSPYRLGSWWGTDQTWHAPLITRFVARSEDSPVYKVRRTIASGAGTPLAIVVNASAVPDSYSLPLYWPEAVYSGLSPDVTASIPDDVRLSIQNTMGDGEGAIEQFRATAEVITVAAGASNTLSSLFALFTLAADIGVGWFATLITDVDTLLRDLSTASEQGWLNDAMADALEAVRDTSTLHKVVTGFTGLDHSEYWSMALALRTDNVPSDRASDSTEEAFPFFTFDQGTEHAQEPLVHLGPVFLGYAATFAVDRDDQYASGQGTDLTTNVSDTQRHALDLWNQWVRDSAPTRQLAALFDSIGMIVEQLIYLDDAVLAVADLAFTEGMIGNLVRTTLQGKGLNYVSETLGGASPGQLVRFALRQLLTDLFIDFAVGQGWAESADCLYTIFCWMNSESKRDAITEVFGELKPLGELVPAVAEFLPVGFTMRDLEAGTLFTTLSGVGAALGTGGTVDETLIDSNGLASIRRWLDSTRESCLPNLLDSLRPDFTGVNSGIQENDIDPPADPRAGSPFDPPGDGFGDGGLVIIGGHGGTVILGEQLDLPR